MKGYEEFVGYGIMKKFEEKGAVQEGHFCSGRGSYHRKFHAVKENVSVYSEFNRNIGIAIADYFFRRFSGLIHTIVGPGDWVGGIISQSIAYRLSWNQDLEVRIVPAKRIAESGKKFVVKKCHEKHLEKGNILLFDEILSTGRSVEDIAERTKQKGACIIGLASVFNENGVVADELGVPEIFSLISFDSWPSDSCPLCKKGEPLVRVSEWDRSFFEDR